MWKYAVLIGLVLFVLLEVAKFWLVISKFTVGEIWCEDTVFEGSIFME